MIISFHGSDHKVGVSQCAQGFAELLAHKYPDKSVLLVHTDSRSSEYFQGVRESIRDIRPYLGDRVADVNELAEKARCKDNLHIIEGDSDFGSREAYLPEMAEYLLKALEQHFDLVICDSGCELDHGLSLGALFCSRRIYTVLSQSEICLARTQWAAPLWERLRIEASGYIICKYDKSSPYTPAYVAGRLGIENSRLLTLRNSRYSADAESEHRSLYSYGEGAYVKDLRAIEEDAALALGYGGDPTRSRRSLWKSSAYGKQ